MEVIECRSFKKPDRKNGSFFRKGKSASLEIPAPILSCEIIMKQLEERKEKEAWNRKFDLGGKESENLKIFNLQST